MLRVPKTSDTSPGVGNIQYSGRVHNVFVLLGLGGDSVGILSVELEGEGETQINVDLNVLYRLAPSRSGCDGVGCNTGKQWV